MKKLSLILCLMLACVFVFNASAQMSKKDEKAAMKLEKKKAKEAAKLEKQKQKEEAKAEKERLKNEDMSGDEVSEDELPMLDDEEWKLWKKKAKGYVKMPEALKKLEDEHESYEKEVSSLKSSKKGLQSQLKDKDAKINELQDDVTKLKRDLAVAKTTPKPKVEPVVANTEPKAVGRMVNGIVFKVQIGAFRNKDLSKYFENHENFGGENDRNDGLQKITLGQFRDYWEADTFKKYLREMGVKDAWIVPYEDGVRKHIKEVLESVSAPGGQ